MSWSLKQKKKIFINVQKLSENIDRDNEVQKKSKVFNEKLFFRWKITSKVATTKLISLYSTHTHTHAHTHTHTHTQTRTHAYTTLSLSSTPTHSHHSHALTPLKHTLIHTHTHFLSHMHTRTTLKHTHFWLTHAQILVQYRTGYKVEGFHNIIKLPQL